MSDDEAETEDSLELAAAALLAAIECALPAFVAAAIERRLVESGVPLDDEAQLRAEGAGERALDALLPQLRQLLESDFDSQASTPLSVVRGASAYATAVLADYHVPPRRRDAFVEQRFPDDVYDLVPSNLAALGDDVGELAITWGANKAWAHRRRHGAQTDGTAP